MKHAVVIASGLLLVAGCQAEPSKTPVPQPTVTTGAEAPPVPAPPEQPPERPKVAKPSNGFGFDRVKESCSSFSAHITNAEQTSFLDVHVDVEGLGLSSGSHDLSVADPKVTLAITELTKPLVGEWSCTDIGGGSRHVSARWKATEGTVRIRLYPRDKPPVPPEGPHDRVDVELIDVRFAGERGQEAIVSLRFEGLRIGWLPG